MKTARRFLCSINVIFSFRPYQVEKIIQIQNYDTWMIFFVVLIFSLCTFNQCFFNHCAFTSVKEIHTDVIVSSTIFFCTGAHSICFFTSGNVWKVPTMTPSSTQLLRKVCCLSVPARTSALSSSKQAQFSQYKQTERLNLYYTAC